METNIKQMSHEQVVGLVKLIESYVSEKNDPFEDYQSAASWLKKNLGWTPNKNQIKAGIKYAKIEGRSIEARNFVKVGFAAICGTVPSLVRRMELFEQRLAKIENDLK